MRAVDILGVRVDDVTYAESVALIERFVREGGPHLVVTPNPEIVTLARRDPIFRAVLARSALAIPDGIGVGAVLDYLSGRVPRAPRWMRRLELEFIHRLIVEPRRWRRQLALPRFALLAAVAAARVRLAGPSRRAV